MSRRLKATVILNHQGKAHVLTPADEVPDWAVPLINPKRFVSASAASHHNDVAEPETKVRRPRKHAASASSAHDGTDEK